MRSVLGGKISPNTGQWFGWGSVGRGPHTEQACLPTSYTDKDCRQRNADKPRCSIICRLLCDSVGMDATYVPHLNKLSMMSPVAVREHAALLISGILIFIQ